MATVDIAAADAWSACTEAALECPDLVEIESQNPCNYGYDYLVAQDPAAPSTPAAPPGMAPCYY
jgi:hypothetical protein